MDFLYALIVTIGLRHNAPAKTLPMVMQPGTIQTIPMPLPYVLENYEWGPTR